MRESDVDGSRRARDQDWLTTVVEQEAHSTSARVTGAMIDFVAPCDVAAMLDGSLSPRSASSR